MFNKKTVSCTTCKHIINVYDAQAIPVTYGANKNSGVKYYEYFCPQHRVQHDRRDYGVLYKEFRVNQFGIPDGFMRIPETPAPARRGRPRTRR